MLKAEKASYEGILPLMRMSLDDPLDGKLFFRATESWVELIKEISADPDAFFNMEKVVAGDAEMSYLTYRFLSVYLGNASSKEELERTQCFGFVFRIPSTRKYAPVISVNEETRQKLTAIIQKHTKFPGSVTFSSSAAAIPAGTQDFLPYDFLVTMEGSMSKNISPPRFQVATLPFPASIDVFVLAKLSLPMECHDPLAVWEDVSQCLAAEDKRHKLEVVFKPLARTKAYATYFGYDIFPLCQSVWGVPFQKIAHEIRILISVPGTQPRVEFSTVERTGGFLQSLPSTSVYAHVMNGEEDITTIHVAQTSCPAMAIGWLSYAIHDLVSPFCQIGSR